MTTSIRSPRLDVELSGTGARLCRNILFVATFLLVLLTTTPFIDLSDSRLLDPVGDGNVVGQIATLMLTAVLVLFIVLNQPHVLTKAVTPFLVLTIAWFALSAVFSDHPDLSIRRVILTTLTIFQATVFLLLASGRREFGRLLGICALIVLGLCYAGIVLAPELAIHQPSDVREPELAGAWRGAFAHKNGAGASMALLIFVGLFVIRSWSRLAGVLVIVLASIFMVGTEAKSPMGLLPLVLLTVWLIKRVQSRAAIVSLMLLGPITLCVITLGSVVFEPIHTLIDSIGFDATFTGRNVIWAFAIDHVAQRPIVGFGFQAFWGTSELLNAWTVQESWGYRATDAHNGFLDLSVMTGVVGLALALMWAVVYPIKEYVRSLSIGTDPALTTLFLQVWLFGLCLSSFESVLFSGGSGIWFLMIVSIIGLRFQNVFQLR